MPPRLIGAGANVPPRCVVGARHVRWDGRLIGTHGRDPEAVLAFLRAVDANIELPVAAEAWGFGPAEGKRYVKRAQLEPD